MQSDSLNSSSTDLALTLITRSCSSGGCPTAYMTNRGTVVIQGYTVSAAEAGIDLPPGELLVEIPKELIAEAARSVG
jgi:hypothetical protein